MNIVYSTLNNAVQFVGEDITYDEVGGCYRLNETTYAPKMPDYVMITTDDYPSDLAPMRYCYTEEKGFYINETWLKEVTDEAKFNKIDELDMNCENIINNGLDITLPSGTTGHFTLDNKDQSNLLGIAIDLIVGSETVMWHTDNHDEHCKFYSAADGWAIIQSLSVFKKYHITYFRDLRIYVNSLTDPESVNAITYGFELPDEFKSDVLKTLEASLNQSNSTTEDSASE